MSLTKSESARINGAKSRGPKTAAGKAKSSRNAIKHGIFAKVIVLSNENAQAFDELTEDFVHRFEPRDGVELAIVEQMVAATWRLSRCWEMQTQTLNLEMERDQDEDDENLTTRGFHTSIGSSPSMQLLHRFENSYERIITRAIRTLANIRKNFPLPNNDEQKCRNEPKPPSNDSIAQPPDALIQNDPLLTTPQINQNEPNTSQSPDSSVIRSPFHNDSFPQSVNAPST
jgi:hypothetical protein